MSLQVTLAGRPGLVLVGYFPDMPGRVAETGGADTPRPVDWAVEQFDAAAGQLGARGIDVVHCDGELHADTGICAGHHGRLDELGSLRDAEQVDQYVLEPEDCRDLVLKDEGQPEDCLIEPLRCGQVFNKQGDGTNVARPRARGLD